MPHYRIKSTLILSFVLLTGCAFNESYSVSETSASIREIYSHHMGSIEMDIAPVWVDLPEHITNSPKLHVYVFAQPPTREKNTTARGYWMLIDLADNVDTEENEDTDGE